MEETPYLCTRKTSRDGAVVARLSLNPKVTGSSPVPATKKEAFAIARVSFFIISTAWFIFCF